MEIDVTQLTPDSIINDMASASSGGNVPTISLTKWLRSEHGPIKTLSFYVDMKAIPTFVSTHLVRHSIGIVHNVESNREDLQKVYKKEVKEASRLTPVRHKMVINAQALINVSRKRLCLNSHPRTVKAWKAVKKEIGKVSPVMEKFMVVECVYRNGLCPEMKCCGFNQSTKFEQERAAYAAMFTHPPKVKKDADRTV